MLIGDRFRLNNKINSGSFGEIHLALDVKTNQTVAVKLEPITTKHPQLQYQAKLLAYLTDQIEPRSTGLPRLYYYGKWEKSHVMIMDLLGPSLEELFQRCNKKFDLKTVVMIGIQIIDRLKFLHKKKFIHRDIKPQNFLLGMNQHCATIFMIDLGLSKKYIQRTGDHIPYRDDRSLKGTPRYTSLNSHLGIEQSRRDDLESVVYMLIYFLKGQLPWQNLKQDANYDRYEKILQKKLSVSAENLCYGIPHQFIQLVQYTRGLHFIEQPNYEMMKNFLEQALAQTGQQIRPGDLFCWQKTQNQLEQERLSFKQRQSSIKRKSDSNEFDFRLKDSLFSSKNDNQHQFNPFDTKYQQKPNVTIREAKRQDSLQFNPFDASQRKNTEDDDMFEGFGNQKSSLNKSDDNPFQTRKQEQNQFDNDPFSHGFSEFQIGGRQNNYKNQEFDDPFGDFKAPGIVEL